MGRVVLWATLWYALCAPAPWALSDEAGWEQIPDAPRWELQMLGVTGPEKLAELRASARRRVVTIATVGQGGVSRSLLRTCLPAGSSFFYRSGPDFPHCDPHKSTHDTGQARVILDLVAALGMRLRLVSYQPTEDWNTVARDLAAAGQRCDIVVCFQSFWGTNSKLLTDAIGSCPQALFVVPYAEHAGRPTATCMQAASAKPWGGGLGNFITCAPLARRSDGSLLKPANRDADDTEIINFITPSHHANGPGGTCPAAATTAAVAAYLYVAAPRRPTPTQVTSLLRRSAEIDAPALTSAPPFNQQHLQRLDASIAQLLMPGSGGPAKLDAAGVISLYRAYLMLRSTGYQSECKGCRGKRRER